MKGGNGVFDVAVDAELLFSKHRDGRFPPEAEVVSAVRQRAGK